MYLDMISKDMIVMKANRHKYYVDHDFYCTQCGNKGLPVCRTNHNPGKPGHLKKLFCLQCDKETNHAECISGSNYSLDDFIYEFESGIFTEEGLRTTVIPEAYDVVDDTWCEQVKSSDEVNIDEWMEIFGVVGA